MIVIIEVEEGNMHIAEINSAIYHLSQIDVHSDVPIQTAIRLAIELEHEDRLVIEIMPPPYQM